MGLGLSLVLGGAGSAAIAAEPTWEPAPRADDFVDSIGVCTHWGYGDTPYGMAFVAAKQRLAQSGIRHVRDGSHPRELELWRELGVRTTLLSEPQHLSLEKQLAAWKANPGMLAMIEGPNEPNNFWTRANVRYKGEGWPKGCTLWQDDLYQAVRAEPALANVPVSSPTPIFDGPFILAPLNSFDYLALHPYAGGQMPSASIPWGGSTLRGAFALMGPDKDLKPLVATECGYHNCIASDRVIAGAQRGISETAGGRYFPRHFAEYWKAGFVRTFVYEFLDEFDRPDDPEAHFGLLRRDLTPKPSFTAVSNLISVLSESRWDRDALRWKRAEAPARACQLAIDGPASIHHTVLSRADGGVDVLLWQEVNSFDIKARKDLLPAPVPVTVRLTTAAAAVLYRPLGGIEIQQRWQPNTSFALDIPDEVVILRLATASPTGKPPAAPTDLTASTTAMSATLAWKSAGTPPAAFMVSRNGQYLATILPQPDGSASFNDNALIPGMGFPFAVRAVGANGLVSAAATVTARTPNQRPDLMVKSLVWEPAQPKPGDEVRFIATIANIGSAPTPAVVHGVAVSLDGKTICWSDTSREPLAPGAERVLKTNSGPAGKGTWTCTAGTFHVTATVDDVNRIDESNEQNNRSAPVTIEVK